jgi:hypothetical protein
VLLPFFFFFFLFVLSIFADPTVGRRRQQGRTTTPSKGSRG